MCLSIRDVPIIINNQLATALNQLTGAFLKIYEPNQAPMIEKGRIKSARKKVSCSKTLLAPSDTDVTKHISQIGKRILAL